MTHKIKENRRISEEKRAKGEFDVFISYNHQDSVRVMRISESLQNYGLTPYLYERDMQPGLMWQPELEQRIINCRAAAVFLGEKGIGGVQRTEIYFLLRMFVEKERPVIPVLLENAVDVPELHGFLGGHTQIDFSKEDPNPLKRLIFGITGKWPEKIDQPGVLIASLGDSPVVVSAMYDLLREREGLTLDRVTVLCPKDEEVQIAYDLVKEALTGVQMRLEQLDFKDADSQQHARIFLHKLVQLLTYHQEQDDAVYLSLAGGRKSMAALMAWVVPFFPCVKGLYHVIDKQEELFQSANWIQSQATTVRYQWMHPQHPQIEQLSLVEIPFERREPISESLLEKWLSSPSDDYEEEESVLTARAILQQGDIARVSVTQHLIEQFSELRQQNEVYARAVYYGLLALSDTTRLQDREMEADAYSYTPPKFQRITLHAYTALSVPVHPIFYTLPKDIAANPADEVEQVVICALETPHANGYRTLKEVANSPGFSYKQSASVDKLPPIPSPVDSILIAPLGESPMVVTQLFTLLIKQEQHKIHEVVLIYPGRATSIDNSAKLLRQALAREYNVRCVLVRLPGLDDITSKEDCERYQKLLDAAIKHKQDEYPGKKIDLALSGGRKGMTAMTIFAAQQNHIPYVYHTLITNETIADKIEGETRYKDLMKTDLSSNERQDRLFLRAYRAEGANPYEHFTLFRVPVFFADE